MTTEAYRVTIEDMVKNINPKERGDKPAVVIKPGQANVVLTRIQGEMTSKIVLACDKDNAETRVYSLDDQTILGLFGSINHRRLLVKDDDNDVFPFSHIATVSSKSKIPYYVRTQDDDSAPAWLKIVHVEDL